MLDFISHGLLNLPWYGVVLATLVLTQITIAAVTLYLHRSQTHRGVDFHPVINHFFRLWLWLTTGMQTKEWVAIHRKHHARCETEQDPHSPQILGLKKVLWEGAELYRNSAKDQAMLEQFGKGTPDDWIERNLYSRYTTLGISIMMVVDLLLFGVAGLAVWAVQMAWIPFWAAGVVNGVGHYFGYRNFENEDAATNLVPWGIIIGGEELHNNHHTFGSSAKFSYHWYEFDLGWMYITILKTFGLAKVRKVAPKLVADAHNVLNKDTLQAIIHNRYLLATRFSQALKQDFDQEIMRIKQSLAPELQKRNPSHYLATLLKKEPSTLQETEQRNLDQILSLSPRLQKVYQLRQQLGELWGRSSLSHEELLQKLKNWCDEAEASGIQALVQYAQQLRQAKLA